MNVASKCPQVLNVELTVNVPHPWASHALIMACIPRNITGSCTRCMYLLFHSIEPCGCGSAHYSTRTPADSIQLALSRLCWHHDLMISGDDAAMSQRRNAIVISMGPVHCSHCSLWPYVHRPGASQPGQPTQACRTSCRFQRLQMRAGA